MDMPHIISSRVLSCDTITLSQMNNYLHGLRLFHLLWLSNSRKPPSYFPLSKSHIFLEIWRFNPIRKCVLFELTTEQIEWVFAFRISTNMSDRNNYFIRSFFRLNKWINCRFAIGFLHPKYPVTLRTLQSKVSTESWFSSIWGLHIIEIQPFFWELRVKSFLSTLFIFYIQYRRSSFEIPKKDYELENPLRFKEDKGPEISERHVLPTKESRPQFEISFGHSKSIEEDSTLC